VGLTQYFLPLPLLVVVKVVTLVLALAQQLVGQVVAVQEVLPPQVQLQARQVHLDKVTLAAAVQDMAVQTTLVAEAEALVQLVVDHLLAQMAEQAEQVPQTVLQELL
jgi:hypothetical protein